MQDRQHLPDVNHLSVIAAMILLAYSFTAFIKFPTQTVSIQLPGFLLRLEINFITIVAVIVSVMAAAGEEWLISGDPQVGSHRHWPHWLLPAFSALIISVPLAALQVSSSWWAIFGLGGLLLIGILVAEYISVDRSDTRYPIALTGLTAVALALFLVLIIAVRGSGFRLYVLQLAIVPATALVSIKALYLRLGNEWKIAWAAGITVVIAEIATGLYYLPITPLQFGLILTGLVYALFNLAGSLEEHQSPSTIWIEPLLVTLAFSGLAVILR